MFVLGAKRVARHYAKLTLGFWEAVDMGLAALGENAIDREQRHAELQEVAFGRVIGGGPPGFSLNAHWDE